MRELTPEKNLLNAVFVDNVLLTKVPKNSMKEHTQKKDPTIVSIVKRPFPAPAQRQFMKGPTQMKGLTNAGFARILLHKTVPDANMRKLTLRKNLTNASTV